MSELNSTIVKHIERLGGRFKPNAVNENNLVTLDGYTVPEPIRQFLFEVEWPQNVTYVNSYASDNIEVWNFVPVHMTAPRQEYQFLQKHPDAQIIGIADGGNYYLLLLLDCENSANPPVYRLDHDDDSGYAQGPVALSRFLASLRVDTRNPLAQAYKLEQRNTPKIHKHEIGLQSEDSKVRYRAAKAFTRIRDARVVPILIEALSDASPGVLIQAAYGLGILRDSSAIEPLEKLLNNPDKKVAVTAVEGLARIGGSKAIEILIEAIGKYSNLQFHIGSALGEIVGVAAMEQLFEALTATNSELHFYCAMALTKIGEPTVEGFIKLLTHPAITTRTCSVRALGEIGDKRAVEPLIAAIVEPDTYLRYRIIVALGNLGDACALPVLERLALEDEGRLSGDGFELKVAAAEALNKLKQRLEA